MAYTPHTLAQFGGTFMGSPEIWTTSMRMLFDGDAPMTQDQCDAVDSAFQDFFTAAGTGISGGVDLQFTKLNRIDAAGHYQDPTTVQTDHPAGSVTGANGGGPHPPQVALVLSLISEGRRGAGSHGRMYLPGVVLPVTSGDWRISEDAAGGVLSAAVDFINAAGAGSGGSGGQDVVLAPKSGGTFLVSQARVGRVFDTMRSRRNKLVEDYATAEVQGGYHP